MFGINMGINIDRWILPGGYDPKQHQLDNEFQPYKFLDHKDLR